MASHRSIFRIFSVFFIFIFVLAVIPQQSVYSTGVVLYAKPAASGTGDCSTWTNACSLQTALTTSTSGDEIWVAAGVYKPTTGSDRSATFRLKTGVAIYGGFTGVETLRTQRAPNTNLTILSGDIDNNDSQKPIITDISTVNGNESNSYHVVSGANGTLDGFTITAGHSNVEFGAGMYNNTSSPTLINVTFSGNLSDKYGGAMFNYNSSPTLTNVTFSSNRSALRGGGMYNWTSNPILTDVTFERNRSEDGGGMFNIFASSPQLTEVTFHLNSGDRGGGMYNDELCNPTLTDVTFSSNTADYGGGVFNGGTDGMHASPTLTNVTFKNNEANWNGAGMYNYYSDSTLTNVTFSGNSADSDDENRGGGLYNYSSNPILTNVTFTANSADFGGGIFNLGSHPVIRNTILWGDNAPSGFPEIFDFDFFSTVSYSVVQGGFTGATNIITDPNLGTLGDHGGFTQTIPLLDGSSAIDAGDDAVCPLTDQRGISRPQGTQCDIGAYEKDIFTVYLPFIMR